ncbi:MAG: glutathione binding-like protein, partial [Pseudomonadota bacterium]
SNSRERAEIRVTAQVFDLYIMNAMLPLFGQLRASPRDSSIVKPAIEACLNGLRFAETGWKGGNYAVGNKFSLADCIAAPTLLFVETFLPMFDVASPLSSAPALSAYWNDLQNSEHASNVLMEMRNALAAASN